MKPEFIGSWTDAGELPVLNNPEYAFLGRSNVGKSTLINLATGFSHLARASNTPGRTQTINLFEFGGRTLADLPGYGYSVASKSDVRAWQEMVAEYIGGRPNLVAVMLLIDSRRGFMQSDIEVMDAFDRTGTNYQIILTKTDKLNSSELKEVLGSVKAEIQKRPAARADVIITSAAKKIGAEEVRKALGIE
ncbi:MAG: ribosome biogenesis GTP-binding protein YihA/YsxC [Rickettsiales bacterium]|jgi:GTP-binding protein|nr:ribosome biogenesis GTP-binding protein YihA/YsxC [Rickettsiales bacterium]